MDAERAADVRFIESIANLINDAYRTAENGLWRSPVDRVTVSATTDAVRDGELVVATVEGGVAGAVLTRMLDAETAWFGALAVHTSCARQGIGTALVDHVHAHAAASGRARVQLEMLAPSPRHPHTDRLASWYRSMGYEPSARIDFRTVDPVTASHLCHRCDLIVCHKLLAPRPP